MHAQALNQFKIWYQDIHSNTNNYFVYCLMSSHPHTKEYNLCTHGTYKEQTDRWKNTHRWCSPNYFKI